MLILALVAFVSLSNCSTNPEETEPDKTEKPENPNGSNDSGDGSDENGGNDNTGGGSNGDGGDDNGNDNGGDDNDGDGSGNNSDENGDNGGSDNTGGSSENGDDNNSNGSDGDDSNENGGGNDDDDNGTGGGGENGDDDNNNGDNNGGDDDTGGGGGADKITHGPYKIGDWYNDGKNEGWVYYVEGDGYHGSIFSGHIGSVESCSLLEDYLKDIPEGWQLLSSYDISKIRDDDAKVKPELIDIVKQSFMVSKDVVSSQYYAGSDCCYHFFYVDSELLCGVTYVGDGVKLNLCITYYF
jgi:hypothetical protein